MNKRATLVFFALIISTFIFADLRAQDFQFTKLSQTRPMNIFRTVLLDDTLMFTGGDDLAVWDISDEDNPEIISVTPIGCCPWNDQDKIKQILRYENYLYLNLDSHYGSDLDTIGVVDISDIYNPVVIDVSTDLGSDNSFISIDSILIAGCKIDGDTHFRVYNIADGIPDLLETITFGGVWFQLFASDDYFFLQHLENQYTCQWDGTSLVFLDTLSGVMERSGEYSEGFIYRTESMPLINLQITDANDPLNPVIIGEWALEPYGLIFKDVDGDVLVGGSGFLTLNDISDPFNPSYVATIDRPIDWQSFHFYDAKISGEFLFTNFGDSYDRMSLRVYDIADLANYTEYFTYEASFLKDFHFVDENTILLTQAGGMYLLDVQDPENPETLWSMFEDRIIENSAFASGYAYYQVKDGPDEEYYFEALNLTDPLNPVICFSEVIEEFSGNDIEYMEAVDDSTIYCTLGSYEDALYILDVSDPADISLYNALSTQGINPHYLEYENDLMVLWDHSAAGGGCKIVFFDIEDHRNPVYISAIPLTVSTIWNGDLSGNYLYVFHDSYGHLGIYDVSEPEVPELIHTMTLDDDYGTIECENNVLYFDSRLLLRAYDVIDPVNPVPLDSVQVSGYGSKIEVRDSLIYCGNGKSGLVILSNGLPPSEITLSNNKPADSDFEVETYPNPFNGQTTISFKLQAASEVKLTVYDVTGREVASLVSGHLSAGLHDVTWNAEGMTSGVYFVRLAVAGRQTAGVQKVLLVK